MPVYMAIITQAFLFQHSFSFPEISAVISHYQQPAFVFVILSRFSGCCYLNSFQRLLLVVLLHPVSFHILISYNQNIL